MTTRRTSGVGRSARTVVATLAALLVFRASAQQVVHVPGDYPTIQEAVDACPGCQVLVAPGQYTGFFDFDFASVIGTGDEPEDVIITGTVRCWSLTNVCLQNGSAYYDASMTMTDCVVRSGRVSLDYFNDGRFIRTRFVDCGPFAAVTGTETFPLFIDCVFENNPGGAIGLGLDSRITAEGCVFRNNGGAIRLSGTWGPELTLTDCVFEGNHGGTAGAISFNSTYPGRMSVTRCVFEGNSATGEGSAIWVDGDWEPWPSIRRTFTDCVLRENSSAHPDGAAIWIQMFASLPDQQIRDSIENTEFCGNTPAHIAGDYLDLGGNTFADACVCPPDVNNDGALDPTDFTAWIAVYNIGAPQCDQNGDGACTFHDFSAWIMNYNAGC